MSDTIENQLPQFFDFVVSRGEEGISAKAARAFAGAVGAPNAATLTLPQALLKFSQLTARGQRLSRNTRLQYLRRLHTLYISAVKQGLFGYAEEAGFTQLIAALGAEGAPEAATRLTASALCRRMAAVGQESEHDAMLADLLLLSVYDRGTSLRDAVHRHKGADVLPHVRAIVRRHQQAPQQQYVFQLAQWREREASATAAVSRQLNELLRRYAYEGSLPDLSAEAWIEAATACGIPDAEIRAAVRHVPAAYSYLADVAPAELSAERLARIEADVAGWFADYTERWYVVRLLRTPGGLRGAAAPQKGARKAPKVVATPTSVSAERIKECLADEAAGVEAFFPYQELVKKVGKRLEKYSRPYISSFIFLRLSHSMIPDVAKVIADYGRFVKSRCSSTSHYSIIADTAMADFRQAIGYLDSGAAVEITEVAVPAPGDVVGLAAYGPEKSFLVEKVIDYNAGRSTVTLQLAKTDDPSTSIVFKLSLAHLIK